jgi:hypothetical protein
MKAERRHELKANSLSQSLRLFPEKVKQYQSQIALGLVLIALAIVLVRYRMNAAEQRLIDAQTNLSIASDDLQRLNSFPGSDLQGFMKGREDFYSEGLQRADDALQKAPDSQPVLKAQALVLKGDFNFNMANFPELPGAATQPSLKPAESEETLLSNASDAYNEVLQSYASEKFAVTAAHFGLGAVAENRAAWDAAKAQYQAIVDSDAETPYKNLANIRLAMLPQLSQPVAVDLPATQPTAATTQPTAKAQATAVSTSPIQANAPAKR